MSNQDLNPVQDLSGGPGRLGEACDWSYPARLHCCNRVCRFPRLAWAKKRRRIRLERYQILGKAPIMNRHWWWVCGACVVLSSCGVSGGATSESVSQRQSQLDLSPQISADFAVDQAVSDFDPNATLLNIAASAAGDYLLSYYVLHTPGKQFDIGLGVRFPAYTEPELVFMRWNAASGAPSALARFPAVWPPGNGFPDFLGVRAVDVDNGWLVVYEEMSDAGIAKRHVRSLARDGTLGSPSDLPGTCANGLRGFARGGSSALLTDSCGAGLLLDLSGGVLASLTIATAAAFGLPAGPGAFGGGHVAFNGIDYLVTYSINSFLAPPSYGSPVLGFPITPAGAAGPPITIASPAVPARGNLGPSGLVANGSAFLSLFSQPRKAGSGYEYSYRIVTEAADHSFALGAQRYLPGGPIADASAASDRQATALALNGHFALTRLRSAGPMELVYPSSEPTLPDVTQALAGALPGGADVNAILPMVSTDSQNSDGKRLLFASNARAVRFDDTLKSIDDPPAALLSSLHVQHMPSFAFAGHQFLATWTETIPNGLGYSGGDAVQVFAQHLSTTATILDAASLRLSPAGQERNDSLITANPSWFATVWNRNYGDGARLTTAEPPLLTAFPPPSTLAKVWGIGTDGVHLVTAFDNHYDIALTQLDGPATWSNAVTVAFGIADRTTTPPVIAFNAGKYAVVWTVAGAPGERLIYGARVSAGLELLDDPPKELLRFSSPDIAGQPGYPADCGLELIASGDYFVLAWATVTGSTEELRIARLSGTLALLDPGGVLVSTQPFPPSALTTRRVALGWDGSYDWVVWSDGEGGTRRPFASLRGRRFSNDLAPADAQPFLISSDLHEMSKVTLAVGEGGRSLVGYTRYLPSDHSYRVRARFLSSAPFIEGVPCSNAGQCESGFCVTGLCSAVSAAGGASGSGSGTAGESAVIGGTAGSVSEGGTIGGPAGGGFAGSGATGGSTGSGIAGNAATGGDTGAGLAGNTATGGDGGSEVASGGAENGGEATDAGANEGGAGTGNATGVSGAGAGHAGVSATMAGGHNGGGGPKGSSCSVGVVGTHSPSENIVSLAGLVTALCWLRRRRNCNVTRAVSARTASGRSSRRRRRLARPCRRI
jgi:hypothetical protein